VKLLVFSDIHADFRTASNLVKRSEDVDVVVGAGDYGIPSQELGEMINALMKIEKPTVLVSGNCENTDDLKSACRTWQNAHVLHGEEVTIDGMSFYGIGGGIPITPFGSWSYDFSEDEASRLLKGCPPGGVLISHSPPKGILDLSSDGRRLGSTALRDTLIAKNPLLVICGHIHASAGQIDRLGETTVINAGPQGIIWDLVANREAGLKFQKSM
jgi:Icc-related predicted phosphoesterase